MGGLMANFGRGTAEVGMDQAQGKKTSTDTSGDVDSPKISPSQVRTRWNDGTKQLRLLLRQYQINKAAVEGDQWTWFNKSHDRLEQMAPTERVRATINKLGPASRSLQAKACERELVFEVTPDGADDPAVRRANIAEAVLEDLSRRHKFEELRETEFSARWEGGTSLICLDWDGQAGTPLGHSDTGDSIATGDIKLTVLSLAEACTEAGARDIETARYWIKAMTLPPKAVQAMFQMDECPSADANMAMGPYQTLAIGANDRMSQVPLTLVMTYYERPNDLCPDGQVAVVVNDKMVRWAKWPFPFKHHLNVVCFRETKSHNRWHGTTILSSAQPVQTGLNASWSSILEHLKQASNARLAIPETAIDSLDQLSDNPGEAFTYNPAGPPPSYMTPPNMPAWWVQMPSLLDSALQDILSWHDSQQGIAPGNLESGLGLSILTEQDDAPMRKFIKETKGGWERLASRILHVLSAKVTETRTAKVAGPGVAPRVVGWKGSNLKDCGQVVIPLDAVMPSSEAAAHARAQALWDRQIITDPKQYARIARMPLTRDLINALDPDVAKAQRENLDLSDGKVCIPAVFDDHVKHIAAHNDYRKSEAYEHLDDGPVCTIQDPESGQPITCKLSDIVDMHVQAHETLAAQAAGAQLAQQMAHPALAQAPNANGQQPVVDGEAPLPGNQTSAIPSPSQNVNPGGPPTGAVAPPGAGFGQQQS